MVLVESEEEKGRQGGSCREVGKGKGLVHFWKQKTTKSKRGKKADVK